MLAEVWPSSWECVWWRVVYWFNQQQYQKQLRSQCLLKMLVWFSFACFFFFFSFCLLSGWKCFLVVCLAYSLERANAFMSLRAEKSEEGLSKCRKCWFINVFLVYFQAGFIFRLVMLVGSSCGLFFKKELFFYVDFLWVFFSWFSCRSVQAFLSLTLPHIFVFLSALRQFVFRPHHFWHCLFILFDNVFWHLKSGQPLATPQISVFQLISEQNCAF